jgi:uncharacterized protein (DUF302 family)
MDYERRFVMDVSYLDAVARVRQALAEQGFGVLTEIDVRATLREKLGLEMEDYLILGACNPDLAHQALQVEPGVGVLLPCNVVVSATDGGATVRILNPQIMASLTGREELRPVAEEATRRLQAVMDNLSGAR